MSDLIKSSYTYFRIPRVRHEWAVCNDFAGMHFWAELTKCFRIPEWIGGIEVHYSEPPEYMKDDEPSHQKCWLLEAPCWHDGSSLWASESWIPFWQSMPHDHDAILDRLCRELQIRQKELLQK